MPDLEPELDERQRCVNIIRRAAERYDDPVSDDPVEEVNDFARIVIAIIEGRHDQG